MMQKVIRMCKSRTFGMRAIAFLLAFLMVISPLTAFAADMDPDISDLPTSGEDVGDDLGGQEITSAVYTVRWLDSNENELASETREDVVGTSVMVNPDDLLAMKGYVFRNEDERNVQTDELAADGSTELKLYFDENEISDTTVVDETVSDVIDDDKIDVTDVVKAPETTEENDMLIEESAEENDMTIDESESLEETDSEVMYTVEWRNGFNQLIQSETRVAKAGSEVSVTEEDKSFDKTGRYFFNEEADNVLYGAAAKDLVLVLFFDDNRLTTSVNDPGNEFRFIVDMRPYGGEKRENVRTNLWPHASVMTLYDKFDWSYAEENFDFEFSHYQSNLGDFPGGTTTPYYGTFWSRNGTDRLNADWYFGSPKDENGVRRITWMPVFEANSVIPKCGFRVDTIITGAYNKTLPGNTVIGKENDGKKYNVSEYMNSMLNAELSKDKYTFEFKGYSLKSGNGVLTDLILDPNNSMTIVEANYEASRNGTVNDGKDENGRFEYEYIPTEPGDSDSMWDLLGDIYIIGDYTESYSIRGRHHYGTSYNLRDIVCDWDSVLNYDLYDYDFVKWHHDDASPRFQGIKGTIAGDFTKIDGVTICAESKTGRYPYLLVDATLRATARSKFSVTTQITGRQTETIIGDTIVYDPEKVYSLSEYIKLSDVKDDRYAYVFDGYEIHSGTGVIQNPSDINSTFVPDNGETIVLAKYRAMDLNTEASAIQLNIHIDGLESVDIAYDEIGVPITDDADKFIQLSKLNTKMPDNYVYTFKGYTIDEGSGIFANISDEHTAFYFDVGRTVITANYEASDYRTDKWYVIYDTISMFPYGNLGVSIPTDVYDTNVVKLATGTAAKRDARFVGWRDNKESTGVLYDSAANYTATRNITVMYAYWSASAGGCRDFWWGVTSGVKFTDDDIKLSDKWFGGESYVTYGSSMKYTDAVCTSFTYDTDLFSDRALYDYVYDGVKCLDFQPYHSESVCTVNKVGENESPSFTFGTRCNITHNPTPPANTASFAVIYNAIPFANKVDIETNVIGALTQTDVVSDVIMRFDTYYNLIDYVKPDFESDYEYTFLGYSIKTGDGRLVSAESLNGAAFSPTTKPYESNIVIRALFSATKKPSLSYDTNGGSEIEPTYAENDQFMVTRKTPVKDGFIFKGWAKKADATDIDYIAGDLLSGKEDRVLYAVWAEDDGSGSINPGGPSIPTTKTYTLSYDTKTDQEIADQKSNTGSFTVTRRIPVKAGHSFAGWSLDTNPTSAAEVDYFAGDVFPATSDVTLYAVFVPNSELATYSVTYDTQGGSEVKPTTPIDGQFMVTRQVPMKKGYTFAGWALESDSKGIDYIGGDRIAAIEDVTLYAIWVKDTVAAKYTLSYDTQGGSEVLNTEAIDGKFMVTRRTPKKDGKVFLGWSLYPNDNDIDYLAGDMVLADKNVTLYAVYTDAADAPVTKTYTITYNTNGGSAVAETKSYNGIFTVTRRMPEKEGLTFVGWTRTPDSENANDVDYVGGDSFPAEEDLTLYALYVKATPPIHVNGGSEVETTVTVENNQYIIVITIPTKPGYTFPGWDTDGDGTPDVEPGDPIVTDDLDTPIDAVWELKVTPAQYVTTNDSTWLSNVLWDSMDTVDSDHVRGVEDALIDSDGRAMVQIPDSVPVRTGYVFVGWELSNPMLRVMARSNAYYQAGDAVYMDEIDSAYENGLRFTAIWEPEDSDDGNTPGTGDKPDTDDGNTPGTGDKPDTDDGNTPGTGDKPDTDDGNTPGTGDKPGTDDGNTPGTGDKPGTDDGNTPGTGDKPGTDDGNTPGIGDKPGTDDGNTPGIGDKPTLTKPGHTQPTLNLNYGKPNRTPGMVYRNSGRTSIAPKTGDTTNAVKTTTAALALLGSLVVLSVTLERKKRSIQ